MKLYCFDLKYLIYKKYKIQFYTAEYKIRFYSLDTTKSQIFANMLCEHCQKLS